MWLLFCQTSPWARGRAARGGEEGGEAGPYQQPIRTFCRSIWLINSLMVLHLFTYLLSTTCAGWPTDPGGKVEKDTKIAHGSFFFLRESLEVK